MCQLLLTSCQLIQLAHGVVEFLRGRVRRGRVPGFVLVFFQIHFEFEHLGQVATGTKTAAARIALERHLHIGKRRLGPQQVPQRFLLRPDRLFQIDLCQALGGRVHRLGGLLEVVDEAGDLFIDADQLPRTGAPRQRLGLVRQCQLQFR